MQLHDTEQAPPPRTCRSLSPALIDGPLAVVRVARKACSAQHQLLSFPLEQRLGLGYQERISQSEGPQKEGA